MVFFLLASEFLEHRNRNVFWFFFSPFEVLGTEKEKHILSVMVWC